jgi:hypothetical protein
MLQHKFDELSEAMRVADEDPATVVAHARMHRLIALKPG